MVSGLVGAQKKRSRVPQLAIYKKFVRPLDRALKYGRIIEWKSNTLRRTANAVPAGRRKPSQ